jgi:hypothetical protein
VEVNGEPYTPDILLSGKMPPVPIEQEAGWAPEPVWMLWSTEKSVAPAGNRISDLQPVAREGKIEYNGWKKGIQIENCI